MTHPERIGAYKVLGVLGHGGMGDIYMALDGEGRTVAVKVMRAEIAANPQGWQRLRREVAAMCRVQGPNVAEIAGYELDGPQPHLATRYVQGRSLRQVVGEHGPLQDEELERLGVGLARALAAIHEAGVVHRDITPSNVMLVDGEPIVIDLGIALVEDMTRMSDGPVGTPGFIAPEVLEGNPAEHLVDVFAWGAVMAFAATGRKCFGDGRPTEISYRTVHHAPDLSGVPDRFLPVIAAALSKDPARRPSVESLMVMDAATELEGLRARYREEKERGDDAAAERTALRIHRIAVEIGDRDLAAWTLLDIARRVHHQGDLERAEDAYARARDAGVREVECWALDGLGNCARKRGDYELAGRRFAEALGIAVQIGQRELHVWSLSNLGACALRTGDFERGVDLYGQAGQAAGAYGLRNIEGWAADGLGACLRKLGDGERAVAAFREAKAIAEETGNRELVAWSLDNLGNSARDRGDHEAARSAHQEALDIGRDIGHSEVEGWSLVNLARAHEDLGEEARAGHLYREALVVAERLGNADLKAEAVGGIGRTAGPLT